MMKKTVTAEADPFISASQLAPWISIVVKVSSV